MIKKKTIALTVLTVISAILVIRYFYDLAMRNYSQYIEAMRYYSQEGIMPPATDYFFNTFIQNAIMMVGLVLLYVVILVLILSQKEKEK